MHRTSLFSLDDPAVNLQIYRTDDALFIHRPSRASAAFKTWFRPFCNGALGLLCFFLVILAIGGGPPDASLIEKLLVPVIMAMAPFVLLGLVILIVSEQRLIRINSSHIIYTSWLFGPGSIKSFERQGKLELCEHKRFPGTWMFKDQPQGMLNPEGTCLDFAPRNIAWIRKVLEEFNEVGNRPPGGCVGDSRPESLSIQSAEYRTLPPSGRQPTSRESSKSVRSALRTMEYNGKPLVRLPHPSEKHASDEPPKTTGLLVRCPNCNAALPDENGAKLVNLKNRRCIKKPNLIFIGSSVRCKVRFRIVHVYIVGIEKLCVGDKISVISFF